MHDVGSRSWHLSVSVDPPVPFALYVRDALGLDTSADELAPPPLVRPAPDRSGLLTVRETRVAATDWGAWWRATTHHEALSHGRRAPGDFLDWYRAFAVERAAAVGEPPAFDALAASPALRHAAVELAEEFRGWPQEHGDATPPSRVLETAGDVAEEVAVRHGVPAGDINGVVLAHATRGRWWRVVQPGVVTCSLGALETEATATAVIRAAFTSSVLEAGPDRDR